MPTRTTTFNTNDNVTASDLNSLAGAWNSYTPQVDQGVTNIAKTIEYAKYLQFGKLVIAQFHLVLTGTGTAGSAVLLGLPVTAASTSSGHKIGTGGVVDVSATFEYPTIIDLNSTTRCAFLASDVPGSTRWGVTPSIALAAGDQLRGSILYEAA